MGLFSKKSSLSAPARPIEPFSSSLAPPPRSRLSSKDRSRSRSHLPGNSRVLVDPKVTVVEADDNQNVKIEVGNGVDDPVLLAEEQQRLSDLRKLEEKAPRKLGHVEMEDDETKANTERNAMLYHTSTESIDRYRRENTSSDLLGRLYYDDYDDEHPHALSGTTTPLLTPQTTGGDRSLERGRSPVRPPSRPGLSRLSSFERGISFDTSENMLRQTVTFKMKHPQFKFRRNNKTFLCGFNNLIELLRAIEWLFDEMIVHGDTIIVLAVLDEKQYKVIDRHTATAALKKIEALNEVHRKKVKLIFEVAIGKPQKLLKQAIQEYNPQMMIIGTKHYDRKMPKQLFAKELFSKHFLECALVPVILVKPTYHYVEELHQPIDSPFYFENWLRDIDVSGSFRKKKGSMFSPSVSRGNSYTNLSQLVPDRGPDGGRGREPQPNLGAMVAERMDRSRLGTREQITRELFRELREPLRERGRSPAPVPSVSRPLMLRSRLRLKNRLSALFS